MNNTFFTEEADDDPVVKEAKVTVNESDSIRTTEAVNNKDSDAAKPSSVGKEDKGKELAGAVLEPTNSIVNDTKAETGGSIDKDSKVLVVEQSEVEEKLHHWIVKLGLNKVSYSGSSCTFF